MYSAAMPRRFRGPSVTPGGPVTVAVNYRGYGGSGGKPGERELMADGLAIFDAVAARPTSTRPES